MAENQETMTSDTPEESLEEQQPVEPSSSEPTEDTSATNEYEPSDDELATLDDEEFDRWVQTNEFPEAKKSANKKEDSEQEDEDGNTEEDKEDISKSDSNVQSNSKLQQENKVINDKDVDYKAICEQIFKPFKANGKEIVPRSIEDIITLMQKGANYTKKMQDLAPMRQAAESLTRACIDANKLAYLIDLNNGNKEAIKKLLKDNKLDLTDFDLDEEVNYQPTSQNLASKSDIEFQDALLDSSKNLDKIKDILYNQWDEESRQKVLQDPELLRGLNTEIELGRFDYVQKILDSEKVFNRYKGKPDVIAYIELVNKLIAAHEQSNNTNSNASNASTNGQQTRKQTNRVIPSAGDKSKAAPSKGKPTPVKARFTPEELMDMPEEEFLKLSEKDLI